MKFQLSDKYYKAAEEICKKGYVFQSDEMILKMPAIYSAQGKKHENEDYRVVYSPSQRLFICEEVMKRTSGGEFRSQIFSTDGATVIENFIKWTVVNEVLSEDASVWIKESISTTDDDWETILFDLMKNVDLTEKECKYLEIDLKRALSLRRSSNLGLI
jgi:hypothetical protein